MAEFRQESIAGGHLLIMETEVGDGHLRVEDTWQHIYDRDEEGERIVVGSVLNLRKAWINGHVVLDPDYAQRLWREACQL